MNSAIDTPCRFDGTLFDAGAITRTYAGEHVGAGWRPGDAWHGPDGRPWVLMYHCGLCGQVHWTAPALECDGSCADHATAVREACAAVRAAGHEVPEAEIAATIAAGLPSFALNLRPSQHRRMFTMDQPGLINPHPPMLGRDADSWLLNCRNGTID